MPVNWITITNRLPTVQITINPSQKGYFNGIRYDISKMQANSIYSQLTIAGNVLMPHGLLTNWCLDFLLSNQQIYTAFTHTKEWTQSVL